MDSDKALTIAVFAGLAGFLLALLVNQQTPGTVCGVSQDQRTIVCYPSNISVRAAANGTMG